VRQTTPLTSRFTAAAEALLGSGLCLLWAMILLFPSPTIAQRPHHYGVAHRDSLRRDGHPVHHKVREQQLGEAVVAARPVTRINNSAYNVTATDARRLHNSSLSLSDAVGRMPGMKLRESGGVGSDMQLMLDGFSGKHVRIFIDGVPQEGVGQSFSINNIPINFAERIEVYRGVVPVEYGADALGGVINIVTGKKRRPWWVDASYSFGSFNTHKSYVNFGQNFKSGLFYQVNAFQNYSDNSYKIDTKVKEFMDTDGDGAYDISRYTSDERRVKRFNDTYHNEAVTATVGVVDKAWADRLTFSMTASHLYKEIQNGVRQEVVFGQKHRKGYTLMPAMEYYTRHFLTHRMDLRVTANYNHNVTRNIDTAAYEYNWYGQAKYTGSPGEQSYQNNEQRNRNWNATVTANYRPGARQRVTFSNTFSAFNRDTRSYVDATNQATDYTIGKVTRKNITGLSYYIAPHRLFNVTAFGKFYHQYNQGPISANDDGVGNYYNESRLTNTLGYGAAATVLPLKGLQAKLSYEKAVRLPSTDELFGDEDLEAGRADLKAERSDNYNFNLSYSHSRGRHGFYGEVSLIYRDTKDFIRRGIVKGSGNTQYGLYENFGRVKTKGYNLSARYNYGTYVNVGATYTATDARDDERYLYSDTQQANLHYRDRIPNQPYRFANFDAAVSYPHLFRSDDALTVSYDSYWQHGFPLNWESISSSDSKRRVPEQWSHNLTVAYAFCGGRYNVSLECRNLTDAALYDNYSLQKAGRAFYAKVRVSLGK
jgi:outer membrane cobalamin receptor